MPYPQLTPSSTTIAINSFLSSINIPGLNVHPRLVEFNDTGDRKRKIVAYTKQLRAGGMSEEDAVVEVAGLKAADTLSFGIRSMKQSGSVVMLAAVEKEESCEDKAESGYLVGRADFATKTHVVLYFLKHKVVSARSSLNCFFYLPANTI
jgi:hypothetical protein